MTPKLFGQNFDSFQLSFKKIYALGPLTPKTINAGVLLTLVIKLQLHAKYM